jgi:uncharacterized membrane protein YraQ (UPF0718 family)
MAVHGQDEGGGLSWEERLSQGRDAVREILVKVWAYVLVGIALGAGIHGYVPTDALGRYMGKDAAWWPVPLVVLAALPLYSNAAGMAPVLQALVGEGRGAGDRARLMMAVVGVSLPVTILLRRSARRRSGTVAALGPKPWDCEDAVASRSACPDAAGAGTSPSGAGLPAGASVIGPPGPRVRARAW